MQHQWKRIENGAAATARGRVCCSGMEVLGHSPLATPQSVAVLPVSGYCAGLHDARAEVPPSCAAPINISAINATVSMVHLAGILLPAWVCCSICNAMEHRAADRTHIPSQRWQDMNLYIFHPNAALDSSSWLVPEGGDIPAPALPVCAILHGFIFRCTTHLSSRLISLSGVSTTPGPCRYCLYGLINLKAGLAGGRSHFGTGLDEVHHVEHSYHPAVLQ